MKLLIYLFIKQLIRKTLERLRFEVFRNDNNLNKSVSVCRPLLPIIMFYDCIRLK